MDKLSEHLKDHYNLVGIEPGLVIVDGETVDLRKVSLEKADELVNRKGGFRYLKAKKKANKAESD